MSGSGWGRGAVRVLASVAGGVAVLAVSGPAPAQRVGYQYDALGRLVRVDGPAGGVATYAYDPAGNRTQVTVTSGATAPPPPPTPGGGLPPGDQGGPGEVGP